ncbi:MAG TPA: hypothetical protein ENL27_01195, partial [Candidatus Parcubacteria bacterium]|nr:hypothetical protein [Candidatus Parcubacteria bacterium]
LLYKTSSNNKIYGKNTNIIFKLNKLVPPNFELNCGHTGIYVGKDKYGIDMVVESVPGGVIMDPLKYFVNLENNEKFLGAKIPKNATKNQREAAAAIARALAKLHLKYDFSYRYQKGPESRQWTCVGLTEKVYESTNPQKIKELDSIMENDYGKVFQILEYNPSQYQINITPDGYDNKSVYNQEANDVFSATKEFSKISRRKQFGEIIGTNCGREYNGERYFFFPWTQYLQPTLESVPLSQDKINKLQGYFSKEVEERYKGKVPLAEIAFLWTKDNFVSTNKVVINKAKKGVNYAANKVRQGFGFVFDGIRGAINSIGSKGGTLGKVGGAHIGGAGEPINNNFNTGNKNGNSGQAKDNQSLDEKETASGVDSDDIQKEQEEGRRELMISQNSSFSGAEANNQESQKNDESFRNSDNSFKNQGQDEGNRRDEQEKNESPQQDTTKKKNESGQCSSRSIDINNASAQELDKLIGIGPVLAERIIKERPFFSVDELVKVKGIGGKTLEKIVSQGCAFVNIRSNHVSGKWTGKTSSEPGANNSSSGGANGGGGAGNDSNDSQQDIQSYPKILISEIEILPVKQRFIELYNPNDEEIDLSGWYIQRKTKNADSWASLISSTKFEGKSIASGGYFLIMRQDYSLPSSISADSAGNLNIVPDIVSDFSLSNDNVIILKNPNREIVDKLGWGDAQDYETAPAENPEGEESLSRLFNKNDNDDLDYIDTDNNSQDFSIQEPTPKFLNSTKINNSSSKEEGVEEGAVAEELFFDIFPAEVDFSVIESESGSQKEAVVVANKGSELFNWQAEIDYDSSSNKGWLDLEPSAGKLTANESESSLVFLTESASLLPSGKYYAAINFFSDGNIGNDGNLGKRKEVKINLSVVKKEGKQDEKNNSEENNSKNQEES